MDEGFKKQKVVNIGKYRLEQLKSDKTDKQLNQEILDLALVGTVIKSLFETSDPSIDYFPITKETTMGDLASIPVGSLSRTWSETIKILVSYFDKHVLVRDLPKEIEKRVRKNNKILLIRYEKK